MADLKISQLAALPSAGIDATDQLPLADISASQTKKVTPLDLINAGVRLMPVGSIPAAKVDWSGGVTLGTGSVGTTQLANGSVTTIKVADGAITDAKITGPIGLSKLGTAAANTVLAGPATGPTAVPTFRALTASDLPIATTTTLGAVKVSTSGGLTLDAAGTLGLTVTAANLPVATAGAIGAVMPGAGLNVDATGSIGVSNTIAPGTGVKVTYNAQGMITGVSALAAADIPNLDASKITSGTLAGSHIADRSITQQKLADYATAYIQEASPGTGTGTHPIGQLWFQESTAKLAMWNGNSFMPVGQGALSDENMRFCGLFNATTGLITAVTPYGTVAGLTNGGAIPTATNQLTGVYLACDTAGTHDGKVYDAGDWIMCLGQARGWERVDLATGGGGGGGGGASKLADLIDVTLTTPTTGDVLAYNGTQWVNGGTPDPGSY